MRVLASLAFAALACVAGPAGAQDVGDVEKGHAFARELCAVCHAVEAGETDSPRSDAPTFDRIAAEPGMTATALYVFLQNPHRRMPDFVLADEEMSNVIAYILTLQR